MCTSLDQRPKIQDQTGDPKLDQRVAPMRSVEWRQIYPPAPGSSHWRGAPADGQLPEPVAIRDEAMGRTAAKEVHQSAGRWSCRQCGRRSGRLPLLASLNVTSDARSTSGSS